MTSPVFELVKVVEVDIRMGEDFSWTTRIEIFRDTEPSGLYRCRAWESELFRLTPSFPRDEDEKPAHVTDDTILVARGIPRSEIASRLAKPFSAFQCTGPAETAIRPAPVPSIRPTISAAVTPAARRAATTSSAWLSGTAARRPPEVWASQRRSCSSFGRPESQSTQPARNVQLA